MRDDCGWDFSVPPGTTDEDVMGRPADEEVKTRHGNLKIWRHPLFAVKRHDATPFLADEFENIKEAS